MARRQDEGPRLAKQWARLPYVVRISVSGWSGGQLYSYAKRVGARYGFKVVIEYPDASRGEFGYAGSYSSGLLTLGKVIAKDETETRKQRARALVWLGLGIASTVVGLILAVFSSHPLGLVGLPFILVGAWPIGWALTGSLQAMYQGSFLALTLRLPSKQKPPVRGMSVPITPAELIIVGGRTLTLGAPGTFQSKVCASWKDADCELAVAELEAGFKGQAPLPGHAVA